MNTQTVSADQVRDQHSTEQAELSIELYHLNARSAVVSGRLKELSVIMQTVAILAPQGEAKDNKSSDKKK